MSTEAMKLALEALGLYARTLAPTETQKKGMEAITALDEALAQPQQEPVAWMHEWEDGEKIPMLKGRDDRNQDKPKTVRPLVYGDTSPPAQRKPLTDEQIYDMYNEPRSDAEMVEFARAIEAAHNIKEKNT